MRTTVTLDERLLAEAKQVAARSGRTLSQVIEDALRQAFAARPARGARKPVRLVTFRGRGLRAGVDLDSSAALLDAMDE